ncbi:MAG: hypothetical protein L0Y75_07905 [Acidobacteria bacterium]|nr:hypothetical protein [Acidobacteriota bacterium]
MSAGDIIDRAVRLYRRNFLALLRIVIAPSLVAYAGSILMSIGWRNLTLLRGDARVAITFTMILVGFTTWAIGKAAFYAVLGGSSRSLVSHFFEGKPILARDVYRAVRGRIWSLVGATIMIGLLIMGLMMIVYFVISILAAIFILMMATIISDLPRWMQMIFTGAFTVVAVAALAAAFLLIYSRIVYVPQILMVEGKGVFNSIGRSFSLAGGEIRRIGALFLFWIYVSWSVLLLLFLPLGYISDWITPLNPDQPLWYSIAWQTVTQLSEILLMPIFMIGCTLLYLDSRVRKEGFDVELLANLTLAPPPAAAPIYASTAPQEEFAQTSNWSTPSILGLNLNDYRPVPANSSFTEPDTLPVNGAVTGDQAVEFATVETAAINPNAEGVIAPGASSPPVSADAAVAEPARKTCRWCGIQANVEDRFCRVCGAVF